MMKFKSTRQIYRIEPIWENLPVHTNTLVGIPRTEQRLRFRREKNSHRGLREFETLKELVIFTPHQDAIDEIGHLRNLEFLYIDQTRATDLSPIANCRNLRHLTIKGATQATELGWVTDIPLLQSFLVENFKQVTDITPLGSLATVKALGIEGSMWTPQKVNSFASLAQLSQLEALFITNCRPACDGLKPLHALGNLRYLEAPAFYTEAEFRELQQALPKLSCDWFDLIQEYGTIKSAINATVTKQLTSNRVNP